MKTIDEVYVHEGYAAETLINGNISECIRYIKEMNKISSDIAFDELLKVKELCPNKYEYVKLKALY
jgi:uncharacterized protein YqgV (UPF0045/DUF77 family)